MAPQPLAWQISLQALLPQAVIANTNVFANKLKILLL
jgi:hypothetical protein